MTGPDPLLEPVAHLKTTVQAFVGRPASHDELLRTAARRWPERIAVEAPSGTLTYAELDRAVDGAAASLAALAGRNSRVAVALSHDLPLFSVPFLASRAGVTVLLLNTSLAPAAWARQLAAVDPVAVVADAANHEAADQAASLSGHRVVTASGDVSDLVGTGSKDPTRREGGWASDTLALIATSGTTGVPKTTRVTSAGLIHAAMGYCHLLGLDGSDRSYVCLPLHYIGPLSAQTTTMALVGGTNVIPDDPSAPAAIPRMAAAEITYVDAVPAWLGLLARDRSTRRLTVPSWRTLIYGGSPMPSEVATTLARRFPDLAMWDVWGLSETHGPATALRYNLVAPPLPGTVGRPLPGVEVRADADPGRPGELLIRGANVTPGYADDPVLTAQVLDGGWLRTGDIGTVGPDGCVRLLDRAKDVIMRGGANVFSVEVEAVLSTHPQVAEAAVYGVPDGLGEEAVAATVVLEPGANLDTMALRTLVDERIGRHAVPRRITTTDSLPRNATGKIDKTALRRRAGHHSTEA